jgi:O-antigen/teichoic acid export membrane protein
VYAATALGVAGSLVVFRVLGPRGAGRYSVVVGVVAFVSLLLELTSDEALVKYGFRYAAQERWGHFHRLVRLAFSFELAAAVVSGGLIAALAPFLGSIFHGAGGLEHAMLAAAPLPALEAVEAMGAAALILRGRYDVRGLLLAGSMSLRLAGLAVGTPYGVTAAIVGVLAAQTATTAATGAAGLAALRRFPAAAPAPLGADRREILGFVAQSSLDTGLVSFRTWIAPLTLGIVRDTVDVGLFRGAQAPQTAFAALSSPVRMILLTEQTRDWERDRSERVFAGLRRYVLGSATAMALALPPLLLAMPFLVRVFLGAQYRPAVDAARLVVGAAAIQLVFGWTKSFAVTIGRPGLRLAAHAVETAVLLPLILAFGSRWGVTGAAAAVVVASAVHAAVWSALLLRVRAAT